MTDAGTKQKKKPGGNWKKFWGFFKTVKLSWGWIILTLAITAGYSVILSFIPGSTAALYAGDFSMAAIMGLVVNYLGMLALSLASAVFSLLAEAASVRSIRNSVWRRMMGVRADYYDANDPGGLLSAVTSDAAAVMTIFMMVIVTVPTNILYLAMCVGQLSNYNGKLLAVLFVMVPVYILYALLIGRWQHKIGRSIQMKIGGLTGFLTERIRNLNLIKSFATEHKEEERGVAASKELYQANVQYQYISGILVGYTFFTEAVGIIIAVIWGSVLLRNGEIDLEAWLAFYLFVPMINTTLRQLSMVWGNVKELQGRASRISELMDAPQEELDAGSRSIPKGDVVFGQVCFGYTGDRQVLSDLDFTIPQGRTTAIVGASGSGKTTILKLLERLYTPNQGHIRVDGKDLGELNVRAWRQKISCVSQDAALFSGTVRDCLTYGIDRQVSDDDLMQAAKLAGIDSYIQSLPGGPDAPLAIWGSGMSGGQRQRLVIARELLRDADILLLDEPTSALDTETAQAVSDTFYTRFRGKTIVTVTHELNFIAGADRIIMLSQGRIVGQGSHEELMETCGEYRTLVEEQSYQEVFAQ